MSKISIIVPIYNSEKYLERCISSILNQTFANLEIILINDGSTDSSPEICNKLKLLDNRIKVIHQNNNGVSAARNVGLKMAKGNFINFVDSDDSLERNMIELLYSNAITFSSDISICSVNLGINNTHKEFNKPIKLNKNQALVGLINTHLNWGAYNKLFRAELAKSIEFEGSINEDVYYCFRVFMKASTFVFQDAAKYNYAVNDDSVSRSQFDLRYMQITNVAGKILDHVKDQSEEVINAAKYNDVIANISIANLILLSSKNDYESELNNAIENLREHHSFILTNKNVRIKHKVAHKLLQYNPKLYTLLMKFYCEITGSDIMNRI